MVFSLVENRIALSNQNHGSISRTLRSIFSSFSKYFNYLSRSQLCQVPYILQEALGGHAACKPFPTSPQHRWKQESALSKLIQRFVSSLCCWQRETASPRIISPPDRLRVLQVWSALWMAFQNILSKVNRVWMSPGQCPFVNTRSLGRLRRRNHTGQASPVSVRYTKSRPADWSSSCTYSWACRSCTYGKGEAEGSEWERLCELSCPSVSCW